jgi:hypothetical protein
VCAIGFSAMENWFFCRKLPDLMEIGWCSRARYHACLVLSFTWRGIEITLGDVWLRSRRESGDAYPENSVLKTEGSG